MVARNRLSKVKKHLREDSQTWKKLSELAKKEFKADLNLIKRLK